MKDIFDSKRFGKYFAYELNTARQNCGLTLLVTCAMPLIYILLELLFTADINVNGDSVGFRWFLAIIALAITVMSFPVKLYGNITERRAGSWWALIPVSRFEKFLSIFLMTCVVLPICFFGLYSAVDALICLISGFGEPLVKQYFNLGGNVAGYFEGFSSFSLFVEFWLNWCGAILTFTLGAIFFRKGKVSKTILVIIAFGLLMSSIAVWSMEGKTLEDWAGLSSDEFLSRMHVIQYMIYIVSDVLLLTGIFFRIKTIKY